MIPHQEITDLKRGYMSRFGGSGNPKTSAAQDCMRGLQYGLYSSRCGVADDVAGKRRRVSGRCRAYLSEARLRNHREGRRRQYQHKREP